MDWKHSKTHLHEHQGERECNSPWFPSRGQLIKTHSCVPVLNYFEVPGKHGDDHSALAEHQAYVYHSGLLEILRSAITAAGRNGFVFDDGSASGCAAQLILSILSMDYEEA